MRWCFRTWQEQNELVENNAQSKPPAHQEVRPPGASAPGQEQARSASPQLQPREREGEPPAEPKKHKNASHTEKH